MPGPKFGVHYIQRTLEEIRLLETHPVLADVDVYSICTSLANDFLKLALSNRSVEITIDNHLRECQVRADANHLQLIFRNLFANCLRATELRATDVWLDESEEVFQESIRVELCQVDAPNNNLGILVMDNGRGIPENLRGGLYRERVSDQPGSDHGLGCIIIKKLLALNGGDVHVLHTSSCGTVQRIDLPRVGPR